MDNLRLSTPQKEGSCQFSRFLQLTALLDTRELEQLFSDQSIGGFYRGSDLTPLHCGSVPLDDLLKRYANYISEIRTSALLRKSHRLFFSLYLSSDPQEDLYVIDIKDGTQLVKARKPVIQLRLASFTLDATREKILPMVFGENEISWGLQLSYPLLFQKTLNKSVDKVDESNNFPNTSQFKKLMRRLKQKSQPALFEVDSRRVTTDLRLGKEACTWIKEHRGLSSANIQVRGAK